MRPFLGPKVSAQSSRLGNGAQPDGIVGSPLVEKQQKVLSFNGLSTFN